MFRNHILVAYGELRIDKIDICCCQKTINEWFAHTKPKYKRFNNYISSVFEYAIALGITEKNTIKKITVPKVMETIEDDKKTNFYEKEQLIEFLESLKKEGNKKAYTLFRLLSFSGLRQGEAMALKWKGINFEDKTLTVSKALTGGEDAKIIVLSPKTKKIARTISLDDGTLDIFKEWRKKIAFRIFALWF